MKKLRFEIDVPDYNWVDAPVEYLTPIGTFTDEIHVDLIRDLIEYLQRLSEIKWIIESNHQHVRHPFCCELVRRRLVFVSDMQIAAVAEQLSHFLAGFKSSAGYKFSEYEFQFRVLSTGKKLQFSTFTMLFNDEDEAFSYLCRMRTAQDRFKPEVVEVQS